MVQSCIPYAYDSYVATIRAYIYYIATCSDSKLIELCSSTAKVSLSPIAPLCLHASPIDSSIDNIATQ